MRKLLVIGATVFAGLAIGGTALAASGPGRGDDNPVVQVSTSDSPSASFDDHGIDPTLSPYPSASSSSPDDHGGDRTTSPTAVATPRPTRTVDDHGGHGADDGPGDDHGHGGGSGHNENPAGWRDGCPGPGLLRS